MSSCLSGASGRTYGFDFDFVKSSSTWTRTSQTSSPSSTISESSNSPFAISTRKPRTPRKRPNQMYNEAAALLSTAYPNLFSTEKLKKPGKFTKPADAFLEESSELLLPFQVFDNFSFPLLQPIQRRPTLSIESKVVNNLQEKSCQSPGEISSRVNCLELDDGFEDFDAESILDEEIEEGIDSIMGSRADEESNSASENPWSGNCFGEKIDFRLGLRRAGVRALRRVDEVNWWNFPTVDILQISPKISKPLATVSTEKKKKKKVEKPKSESKNPELSKENLIPKWNQGLLLKLNYDEILNAWSDKGSPFGDEGPSSDVPGNDVAARLAQIDLLPENGGVREASVLRYKEKRRTRLFSKKIRYQVKKVNADRRPREKGRFVRRANSSSVGQR